jgi:hypothetical protein
MVRRGDGYQLPGQGLKVCRLVRDRQLRDTNQLSGLSGIGGIHRPTGLQPIHYRFCDWRQNCQALGLKQSLTQTYAPKSNGKEERFIKSIL